MTDIGNPHDSAPTPPAPVGELTLERFYLGELPDDEARIVRDRLSEDPSLRARLRRIEEHAQAFAKSHPAEQWVPRIESKATEGGADAGRDRAGAHSQSAKSRSRSAAESRRVIGEVFENLFRPFRKPGWAAGMAMVVLLALVSIPRWMGTGGGDPESVRLKGKTAELKLYLDTEQGPRSLHPGDTVGTGDALQIEFHPGTYRFAAVVSVDGRGSVTWHWPAGPDGNSDVSLLTGQVLPQAFQLDSAPAFERFYLILSNDSLRLGEYPDRLSASAAQEEGKWVERELAGRPGFRIMAFPLIKRL